MLHVTAVALTLRTDGSNWFQCFPIHSEATGATGPLLRFRQVMNFWQARLNHRHNVLVIVVNGRFLA